MVEEVRVEIRAARATAETNPRRARKMRVGSREVFLATTVAVRAVLVLAGLPAGNAVVGQRVAVVAVGTVGVVPAIARPEPADRAMWVVLPTVPCKREFGMGMAWWF